MEHTLTVLDAINYLGSTTEVVLKAGNSTMFLGSVLGLLKSYEFHKLEVVRIVALDTRKIEIVV